jgi:nitrilase
MYPEDLPGIEEIENLPNIMCRGGSAIISPFGKVLAGPLYDREDILFAELDLSEVVKSKFDLDVTGHYARNDIFQLSIDENPKSPVVAQT